MIFDITVFSLKGYVTAFILEETLRKKGMNFKPFDQYFLIVIYDYM